MPDKPTPPAALRILAHDLLQNWKKMLAGIVLLVVLILLI